MPWKHLGSNRNGWNGFVSNEQVQAAELICEVTETDLSSLHGADSEELPNYSALQCYPPQCF